MHNKDSRIRDLLEFITYARGEIFTTEEATRVGKTIGVSRTHVGKMLTQMVQRDLVARIEHGLYASRSLATDSQAIKRIAANKEQLLNDRLNGTNERLGFLEVCAAQSQAQTPREAIDQLVATTYERQVSLETFFENAEPEVRDKLGLILFNLSMGGSIVVCGPSGSGKTALLRALASKMSDEKFMAVVEDSPELGVETFHHLTIAYSLPSRTITPVNVSRFTTNIDYPITSQGNLIRETISLILTPDLIRIALRAHPDVLVVGEIRDEETLEECLNANHKHHAQVLTTVHPAMKALFPEAFQSLTTRGSHHKDTQNWIISLGVRTSAGTLVRYIESAEPWSL